MDFIGMSCFFVSLCLLSPVSANDPFESLFINGPCFEATEPPDCDTDLAKSFKPHNTPHGANEPTTEVFLFTPSCQDKAEPLHLCGGRLPCDTTYDRDAETEIFIHGWLDGVCRTAWMREMKEQLFERQRCDNTTRYNVILVDWTWGNTPDYPIAGGNCKVVGEQVGFIIKNIMKQQRICPNKFHIVGHSLGAVAAGFAGRSVKGLRRITALDPAYPPYKYKPPNRRITYRDAKLVDVIHSNGGQCIGRAIGDSRPLGHADFYPNGGKSQISCYLDLLISLLKGDFLYALVCLDPRICAHAQSLQYYKVSINPKGCEFVGVSCPSYESFQNGTCRPRRGHFAVMGMDYEKYLPRNYNACCRKSYYLDTALDCPYYDGTNVQKFHFPFKTPCPAEKPTFHLYSD